MLYERELSSEQGSTLPLPLPSHRVKTNAPNHFLGLKHNRRVGQHTVPFHRCYNERDCTMGHEIRSRVDAFL